MARRFKPDRHERRAIYRNQGALSFTPPPPERHVTEGSFFVAADRTIHQVENGQGRSVTYCGVLLRTDGTPNALRIGVMIGLRDLARQVFRSQNDGWPEPNREAARRDLNCAYERFVSTHGAINKTTFTPAQYGGLIRRMPNLAKFRDDPDAMLVMALEDYDEMTGRAKGPDPLTGRDRQKPADHRR